jgi:hypothetical protein
MSERQSIEATTMVGTSKSQVTVSSPKDREKRLKGKRRREEEVQNTRIEVGNHVLEGFSRAVGEMGDRSPLFVECRRLELAVENCTKIRTPTHKEKQRQRQRRNSRLCRVRTGSNETETAEKGWLCGRKP